MTLASNVDLNGSTLEEDENKWVKMNKNQWPAKSRLKS